MLVLTANEGDKICIIDKDGNLLELTMIANNGQRRLGFEEPDKPGGRENFQVLRKPVYDREYGQGGSNEQS